MATNQVIKLKRGTTTPTTGDISSGEVAIDTSAQKFYVNDGGVVKEVGPGATGDFAVDTDTLFVDVSTDRVGINTSSPSNDLHIVSSQATILLEDSDGTNQYGEVYENNGNLCFLSRNNTSHGEISFFTYDGTTTSNRLRIRADGKIGIGTTTPNQLLDVEGATDPSIRVASTGTASTDDAIMRIQIGGTSASSYIYFGDSADADVGNLRYNHSSDELSVIIGAVEEFRFASGGTFHADADIVAYSTTVASDAALKYNINTVENALDKLNSLEGVTFQWKRDDKPSAGVIAQDVEKVMPSAVKEVESLGDNSTHKAVDYNQIIALLVEAVKDQQKQIDELRK